MYSNNIYERKTWYRHIMVLGHIIHRDLLMSIGFYGVCALFILIIFGEWIAPYPPHEHSTHPAFLPPAWLQQGEIAFFFGTDNLGGDIFSRLIDGTTDTFGGAVVVMLVVSTFGIIIGIIAGSMHGFKASFLTHIGDVFLALPSLLLAIIIAALLGPSLTHAMFAIILSLLPKMIHAIANATSDELKKEYVTAMRMDGTPTSYILRDAVLPNLALTIVYESNYALTMAIINIAALGFLGLAAQSPTNEWGVMIGDIVELVYSNPWMMILPGFAIFLCILLVNLLGNGIYRALLSRG